eukprot:12597491-Alexandrium_andersonii.AAC.1
MPSRSKPAGGSVHTSSVSWTCMNAELASHDSMPQPRLTDSMTSRLVRITGGVGMKRSPGLMPAVLMVLNSRNTQRERTSSFLGLSSHLEEMYLPLAPARPTHS